MEPIFECKNIILSLPSTDKEAAIRAAGKALVDAGYVEDGYIDSMLERERQISVYMGAGLAIPHGTLAGRAFVKHSGIVVLQYPEGVPFGDERAHLLIGLACANGEQLEILQRIADVFMELEEEEIEALFVTQEKEVIYQAFSKES